MNMRNWFQLLRTDKTKSRARTAAIRRLRSRRRILEVLESRALLTTFSVMTTADLIPDPLDPATFIPAPGSLRQAIIDANATPNVGVPDTIEFNIPGTGLHTISPLAQLPEITDSVIIDGYSQPGSRENSNGPGLGDNAVLQIELDGTYAGSFVPEAPLQSGNGLYVSAGNSTIRGLAINHFGCDGIILKDNGGNTVEGNFIGTDATGLIAEANYNSAVYESNSNNNTIGGLTPDARNVISGSYYSILLEQSDQNAIQGNFIGTDATGTVGLSTSTWVGILVGGDNNMIGGITANARNIISGNSSGYGIQMPDGPLSPGNKVQGNYIGTDVTGTKAVPNNFGVIVRGGGTIGGLTERPGTGPGNLISGNTGGAVNGRDFVVQGNLVGTDVTGTLVIGNGSGVAGAFGTVGGTNPAARNVISGGNDGVGALGSLIVQGNYIGTDITGTSLLGNVHGVYIIYGGQNLIGGTEVGAGNVIAGSSVADIRMQETTGDVIQGNYIGVDKTGNHTMGVPTTTVSGILIDALVTDLHIGGTVAGAGNVIGGSYVGISIGSTQSSGIIVEGNAIGVGADGLTPVPNGFAGVHLYDGTFNNTIGGTASGAGNVIANNAAGILLDQYYLAPITTGNAILGNSIYNNSSPYSPDSGLGIDINRTDLSQSFDGPNPNDLNDTDTGNNNLQNYPVLTSVASSNSGTTIQGSLNSTPNSTFRIEFFSNTVVEPSGYGEGEHYLGFANVTTDDSGNVSFTLEFATAVGQFFTATATDAAGNTSEFSFAAQAEANHPATFTGMSTGTVTEDAYPNTVSGTLVITDVDAGEAGAIPQTDSTGTYGSFTVTAAGGWTYSLNNSLPAIQALAVGQQLTDSFLVTSVDGTATQVVTIVVSGANDVPVITSLSTSNNTFATGTAVNTPVTVTGALLDADIADTHGVTINWGDGSAIQSFNATEQDPLATATLSSSHIYLHGGTYLITVIVADGHGGAATATTNAIVTGVGVLLLDPSGKGALTDSGNGSVLVGSSGGIVVASTNAAAVIVSGNGNVSASEFDLASTTGMQTSGKGKIVGTINHGAPATAFVDPLTSLVLPTPATTPLAAVNYSGNAALTLQPGTYAGGIHVSGNGNVTLAPGIYYLNGGGLTISGKGSVTGNGVIIYNAPQSASAGIILSGNGSLLLTAPTTGPYQGIAIFQARSSTAPMKISGNGGVSLTGLVYAAGAAVSLSGNGPLAITSANDGLICADLQLSGNASLTINTTNAANSSTQRLSTANGGAGSSNSSILIESAGILSVGMLTVAVDGLTGLSATDEDARIEDAISIIDTELAPYGVSLVRVYGSLTDSAAIKIHLSGTSAIGGVADGVLGVTIGGRDITLIAGWNWYAGAEPLSIGVNQYDFQTAVTHELGHALGLGHSTDTGSVMCPTLALGDIRHDLTDGDLTVIEHKVESQSEPLLAAPPMIAMLEAVAAPAGLVSWWSANSTGADALGQNNATLHNGTAFAAAEVGKGFSFDGVNDWVSLGDPSSLAFTSSFSIEGWIKVNALNANTNFESIMFRGDNRAGLDPYQLVILPNGDLNFAISGTNGGASVSAPVPVGQLVHVAATLDDATGVMTLYENGMAVAQRITPDRPFGDLDPTQNPGVGIGNSNYQPNYNVPFNGLIDELAVYNRALTPGEVLGIAKAGSSGKVFSPIAVDGPSVVEGVAETTTPVTFTIQRTSNLAGPLTVAWTTADDTATAGSDYVAASGSVTFADGQATQTVAIVVNGDNTVEPTETFKLVLTPAGGTPVMGIGTIVADDVAVSIAGASATEGGMAYRFTDNFVTSDAYGLAAGRNILVGPADGKIYVASLDTDVVKVFDPNTGLLLRDLSTLEGELDGPWGMVFGPDGGLYVGGKFSQNIVRFDVGTGASTVFVASTSSGGLGNPRGLTFGPDGNLYASSHVIPNAATTDTVKRYDGTTGAYLGDFVTAGSGGLNDANGVAFGPDGNLYVASNLSGDVKRYNGQTGAFINNFVIAGSGGLVGPRQLLFPGDGNLYVAGGGGGIPEVFRYSATTGAFVDIFATSVQGTDTSAGGMAFSPNGEFYVSVTTPIGVSGSYVARFARASMAAVTVTLSLPMAGTTTVDYVTADGSAVAGSDYTSRSGTMTFAPGETSKTLLVSTVDDTIQENDESFVVNLSNASVNAVITTSQGMVTIHDNDVPPTKFYVVNDGSPDRTYEYGATGSSVENYTINSGNTAPRGAASTAAGTTVWVADANRKVYVYDTSGGLQGSWTAGTLASNATVEGITTNGTDVWIVDSKSDKVFKYTAAASRLSGSQNSSSSFSLNSSNSNPKGIVTDGTSMWVIDDSTTDKIFKYNLYGKLLGSWTIDAANSSPTGLTIDPTNVSNIWTVDSGTDKIYQYTAAASRTSGSQSAALTFALAAGNSNPQDIADPPVDIPPSLADSKPNNPSVPIIGTTALTQVAAPMVSANIQQIVERDPQRHDRSEFLNTVLDALVQPHASAGELAWSTYKDPTGESQFASSSNDHALLELMGEYQDGSMLDLEIIGQPLPAPLFL